MNKVKYFTPERVRDIEDRLWWDLLKTPQIPIRELEVGSPSLTVEVLRLGLHHYLEIMEKPPRYIHLSPRDFQSLVESDLDRFHAGEESEFSQQQSLEKGLIGLVGSFHDVPVLASWRYFGDPCITREVPYEQEGNDTLLLRLKRLK